MNKFIVLTFDYELFLGKSSGTVLKSIINPVDEILKVLSKGNAKGIFFIDATFLSYLKVHKHNDLRAVSDQVKRIVELGNDVALHLHPQWLDAYNKINNTYGFKSYDRYSLHSLTKNELSDVISSGVKILRDIVSKVKPDYKINVFRAGGWCVQPFSYIGYPV